MFISFVDLQQQQQLTANKTDDNIIKEYFEAMQTEINPSTDYVKTNRNTLNKLSQFHKNKPFAHMKREDIISYLNSLRKPEEIDPLHKWIGTYNSRIRNVSRFFKWLYNPTKAPT
jgi:site-specific recombinase XerD